MLSSARIAALVAAFTLPCSVPLSAASDWSFSGKVRAGAEHQSNVNSKELEQASGQSDTARMLEAELMASWQASSALRLTSGYSIHDKHYQQTDNFDSRLHLAYLDASYQLGQTALGSNVYYARADLAGSHLLTLSQASIYALHNLNDNWFVRPAFTAAGKTFSQLSERDASNLRFGTDSFWFFHEGQRFIAIGVQFERENGRNAEFSYQAPGFSIKLSNNFTLWQLSQQLQLGAKYSWRSYQQTTAQPSGNTKPHNVLPGSPVAESVRKDHHGKLEARWLVNITPYFAIVSALEHGDFSSTLESADYQETRSSVLLQLSF